MEKIREGCNMARKYNKNFKNLGKSRYNFEFELEKIIYSNLCLLRVKKKELKKIVNMLEFNTYFEWKQYIFNKYKNYDKEYLLEFSRYLNQGIRNIQPGREYLDMFIPFILTFSITELLRQLFEINNILSDISGKSSVICLLILIFWLTSFFYIIWSTLMPIWNNNIEENMFIDYKEIIDELIEQK